MKGAFAGIAILVAFAALMAQNPGAGGSVQGAQNLLTANACIYVTATGTIGQNANCTLNPSSSMLSLSNVSGGNMISILSSGSGTTRYQFSNGNYGGYVGMLSSGVADVTGSGQPVTLTVDVERLRATTSGITVTGSTATSALIANGTKFTATGCSLSATTGGATAGTMTSGTTGACTVVVTPGITAPTGWECDFNNLTTANTFRQSAASTTTCTGTGTTVTGDVVTFHATGY